MFLCFLLRQGVMESFLGTALAGSVFCLFSGQPLIILSSTGPILIFEKLLFEFSKWASPSRKCDTVDTIFNVNQRIIEKNTSDSPALLWLTPLHWTLVEIDEIWFKMLLMSQLSRVDAPFRLQFKAPDGVRRTKKGWFHSADFFIQIKV